MSVAERMMLSLSNTEMVAITLWLPLFPHSVKETESWSIVACVILNAVIFEF